MPKGKYLLLSAHMPCLALVTNLILSLLILESPTGYRHKPCNNTGVYLVRGRDGGLPGERGGGRAA